MKPVFSVITVTYNASNYLEETILSILEQTYPAIEYIIIDGNSTDGTTDIIKKYENKIFYWISEPDKGLYDAMNKGLEKATGDFVWFINAGDRIHKPDTIEKFVSALSLQDSLPDILYGETVIIDATGKVSGPRRLKAPEKLTWKSFRMGMLVCHQSFIPKRNIVPLYNDSYKYSADFEWCIKTMKNAKQIYNTHMILSEFLEDGMSTTHRKKSLKERYQIMKNEYGWFTTSILHLWFAIRFYFAKWKTGKV